MRTLLTCLVLFSTFICASASETGAEPLQSIISAYLAQVGNVMMPALAPELPPDATYIKAIEVSFHIDPAGSPVDVKVVSTPSDESVEQGFTRVIGKLHFPPIPERILKEG